MVPAKPLRLPVSRPAGPSRPRSRDRDPAAAAAARTASASDSERLGVGKTCSASESRSLAGRNLHFKFVVHPHESESGSEAPSPSHGRQPPAGPAWRPAAAGRDRDITTPGGRRGGGSGRISKSSRRPRRQRGSGDRPSRLAAERLCLDSDRSTLPVPTRSQALGSQAPARAVTTPR